MTTRIVVVDDHQVVRDGIVSLIENLDSGLEIVGQGASGVEAVSLATQLEPDLLLIDVAMPDLNGIEATKKILAEKPDVRIIAVTMHAERSFITGMLQAGAVGYIRKESAFEEISSAITAVTKGEVYLGDGIANIVASEFRHQLNNARDAKPQLSERETQVLKLIAEGFKTREIAAKLFVSDKTVETHRRKISRKLDLYSVAELTKYAIRTGLTTID
ncbi:MAG: response regulator transcription factor [Pseudomonadota bacterium]